MPPLGLLVARKVRANHRLQACLLRQRGFGLLELMVSLAISLVVALAALAVLTLAQQGFGTVGAAAQLRDTARFSLDFLERMVLQAGFQDVLYASTKDNSAPEPAPDLMGVDNAIPVFADPLYQFTRRAAGAGGYGSDVLIVRFQTPQTFPGSGVVDKSLRDCWGNPGAAVAQSRYDRVINILYVDNSTGDLSLMCRTGTYTYAQGVLAVDFPGAAQPVVQGVENFQVLYGTDGVSPYVATPGVADQVIERYLRADQINGEAAWRRVRSLRIGLVLRGPPKSAPASAATTLYPLGQAYSASDDPGAVLTPSLDGRLRQVLAHTIYLRNLAP